MYICMYVFPTNTNDVLMFILLVSYAVSQKIYDCSLMASGRSKPRLEERVIGWASKPICAAFNSNQSVTPACGNHSLWLQVLAETRDLLVKLEQK